MPSDLDRLQGNWNITSLELDGHQLPPTSFNNSSITIAGSHFTSVGFGDTFAGTVELNEQTRPKTFDLIFSGSRAGIRNSGIYQLVGDTWTICLATLGDKRPRKFATSPGSGYALETLQRANASKVGKRNRPSTRSYSLPGKAADDREIRSAGPPTELEGEWAMVSAVFKGVAMAQDMVKWCRRITRGNVTTVVAGPQVMLSASFKLDASQKPAAIDYLNLEGANRKKTQLGIFLLEGEQLQICMAAPGKPRPNNVRSEPGDDRSYTTWRLVQK